MLNMLDAISALKLKNSKHYFSIVVLYLPAYSYTGIGNYIRKKSCKTSCAVTSRLLTRGN